MTTSSQAKPTKTSCFLGPAGPLLYLLWLGAVAGPLIEHRHPYRNLKVWLIAKFPTIPCYSLIQSLGNLRRLVQIHPSAQRLAQWQESAKKPRTGKFPDKLADAREFSAAGELKDIGDWFRRTASATKESAQIDVVS